MKSKKKLIIKNSKILIEDVQADFGELMNVTGAGAVKDLAVDTAKFVASFSKLVVKIGWAAVRYKVFGNLNLKEFKNAINNSNLNFTRKSNRSIDNMNSTTQSLLRSAGYGDSFDKLLSMGMPAVVVLDALGKVDTDVLFRERFKDSDELKIDVKNFSVGIVQSMFSVVSQDKKDIQNLKIPPSLKEDVVKWLDKNIHPKFYDKINTILKSEEKKETKKIVDLVSKLSKSYKTGSMQKGDVQLFINFLIEQIATSKIVENRSVLLLRNKKIINEVSYSSDSTIQNSIRTLCKLIAITIMYDDERIRNIVISAALVDLKDITESDQNEIHKKLSAMALEAVAIASQVNFCDALIANKKESNANIVGLFKKSFDDQYRQIESHIHPDIAPSFKEFASNYQSQIQSIDSNKEKLDEKALYEMIKLLTENVDDYLSQDLTLDNWTQYSKLVQESLDENYLSESVKALIEYNKKSNNNDIKSKNDKNKNKNKNSPPVDSKETDEDKTSESDSDEKPESEKGETSSSGEEKTTST